MLKGKDGLRGIRQSVEAFQKGRATGMNKLDERTKARIEFVRKKLINVLAKLAAFGMRNAEIAEKLHMSLSGVKQAIRIVSEKTGVGRDEFAAFL